MPVRVARGALRWRLPRGSTADAGQLVALRTPPPNPGRRPDSNHWSLPRTARRPAALWRSRSSRRGRRRRSPRRRDAWPAGSRQASRLRGGRGADRERDAGPRPGGLRAAEGFRGRPAFHSACGRGVAFGQGCAKSKRSASTADQPEGHSMIVPGTGRILSTRHASAKASR